VKIGRFVEICKEEGYTEVEAEAVWTAVSEVTMYAEGMYTEEFIEGAVRETCRQMLLRLEEIRKEEDISGIDAFRLFLMRAEHRKNKEA